MLSCRETVIQDPKPYTKSMHLVMYFCFWVW